MEKREKIRFLVLFVGQWMDDNNKNCLHVILLNPKGVKTSEKERKRARRAVEERRSELGEVKYPISVCTMDEFYYATFTYADEGKFLNLSRVCHWIIQ